jgi:hypothetical protein
MDQKAVLFQLDEARRYLEDGRLERLHLALLILDSAAEIQLDRRCGRTFRAMECVSARVK